MSDKIDGGQAYPRNYAYMNPESGMSEMKSVEGMTIRQAYKMAALGSKNSGVGSITNSKDKALCAKDLGEWANAMIAEDAEFERRKG